MPVSVVIAPVAEDRLEDWHAFHSELVGARRGDWAESQRRRGITREAIFFWPSPSGPSVVYVVEGAEAGAAMDALGSSDNPFDVWLRESLAHLHEDLDFPVAMSDTRPPAGSWRGWRALRSQRPGA